MSIAFQILYEDSIEATFCDQYRLIITENPVVYNRIAVVSERETERERETWKGKR